VNSEIHLVAVIDRVWICTGRPCSSEFGHALGGRNRVNSEMHMKAVIDRVWTCTWRPRSSELRDALTGYDRARFDKYLEVVDLVGSATAAETLFIG